MIFWPNHPPRDHPEENLRGKRLNTVRKITFFQQECNMLLYKKSPNPVWNQIKKKTKESHLFPSRSNTWTKRKRRHALFQCYKQVSDRNSCIHTGHSVRVQWLWLNFMHNEMWVEHYCSKYSVFTECVWMYTDFIRYTCLAAGSCKYLISQSHPGQCIQVCRHELCTVDHTYIQYMDRCTSIYRKYAVLVWQSSLKVIMWSLWLIMGYSRWGEL